MKIASLLLVSGLAIVSAQQTGGVDGDGINTGVPTLDPTDLAGTGNPVTQAPCNVDNCIMCQEANICQSCDEGYSAANTDDGSCEACEVQNCAVCEDSSSSCEMCVSGYYLDSFSATTVTGSGSSVTGGTTTEAAGASQISQCLACSITGCGECVVSGGDEVCDTCADGYYMNDEGGCTSCGENCDTCAAVDANGNVGGCLQCTDLYEAEVDGTCGLIGSDCGNNCAECEEHNQCKTCDDGYSVMLFNDGQSSGCAACPTNCASCADADTCDTCEDGYILDDISGSCATQDEVYANVCDCRTTTNNGCTCPGDEATSKDGCCDAGGLCGGTDGVCANYNQNVCTDFDNCAYCFGQSFCGACEIGYYHAEGHQWADCVALPSGWDTDVCDVSLLYNNQCECGCGGADPECVEHEVDNCDGDSVYCDADGACAECLLDGCSFCGNGDDYDTCLICADGYDLNEEDGTCVACEIEGCSSCQSGVIFNTDTQEVEDTIICSDCMDGYYDNIAEGSCTACDAENCQECSETECNKCLDGFSLDSDTGECNSCGSNCLQCSATQCNRCETGYDIVDGACVDSTDECGNNCVTCQRGGQCKICDDGYYVGAGTNGKCVSCIDNCDSCRDGESCSTCSDGYSYDIDTFECLTAGNCLADICDCRDDSDAADNNGCTCLESEDTAKLGCCNADCGLCSDLCATYNDEPCTDFDNCEYCFEQTYCMECKTGYYQPDYQGECVALPDGWDTDLCSVNMLENNECDCGCGGYDPECEEYAADGCDTGEFCSTDGTCETCVLTGCAHCANGDGHEDGTCLECTPGHYQDDDGNCIDCDLDGCSTCLLQAASDDASEDTYSCKECADGYYMNNQDTCSVCSVTECAVCDLSGDCEECNDGFSLFDGACTSCPDNCLDCTGDSTTCKRCDDAYEVLDDGSCGEVDNDCGDNCLVCGAQGVCKSCMNTYFRDTDNVCEACMDNCASCSGASTCNECLSGFGYVDASTSCEAYSDPLEYCATQIRNGVLSEGDECECVAWECAVMEEDTTPSLALRR
mmetsp:Transcript_53134/g.78855  ORF Transcript_53134/g.78855 Transcript_53134/m.78855 type:complete len:1040 (+) Transcript_53134:84-3203(+)|eukprot:CAMPEP_0195507620 /NCGR_PEP_ID=MMETSP0794_2-20130614/1025_1 /TAXON_ID=515487 /ORGANISM="Stephanopyxis turris, Strain CCMP 815" /LENGTH=1039 /DNA_ID=CAMNT_0040634363 /DNA_START=55 /DNA_END=3174 /DNA_ORIENTATION=+